MYSLRLKVRRACLRFGSRAPVIVTAKGISPNVSPNTSPCVCPRVCPPSRACCCAMNTNSLLSCEYVNNAHTHTRTHLLGATRALVASAGRAPLQLAQLTRPVAVVVVSRAISPPSCRPADTKGWPTENIEWLARLAGWLENERRRLSS